MCRESRAEPDWLAFDSQPGSLLGHSGQMTHHESVVQAQGQVQGSAKEGGENGCRDFLDPDEVRLPVPG